MPCPRGTSRVPPRAFLYFLSNMQPDWAQLPQDALRNILDKTQENPLRFAGVCKGWAWLLDEEPARHITVHPMTKCPRTLQECLRSFSVYVCRRKPVTENLDIFIPGAMQPADIASATAPMAAALVHLAPCLRSIVLEPVAMADALVNSPFTDVCTSLEHVSAHVNGAIELARISRLMVVDLSFVGPLVGSVELPSSLVVCRLRVHESAHRSVVDRLIATLPRMHNLHGLSFMSAHHCTIDVSRLAPTLSSLVVVGSAFLNLTFGNADLPGLRVLGVRRCKFDGADAAGFLSRCLRVVAFQWVDNWSDDWVRLDLRHLPLKVVHVLSDRYRLVPACTYPPGIRKAALGGEDLHGALLQPAFRASLECLMVDLHHMDADVFPFVWPGNYDLPALKFVVAGGDFTHQVAALLGQRCPHAASTLTVRRQLVLDIEEDEDLMV